MSKIGVPYLVIHENKDGSKRFYFAPKQEDRRHGWATVRLHDKQQRPIRDSLKAAEACRAVTEIYSRWRAGEEGCGPWRIDKLGRVAEKPAAQPTDQSQKLRRPGQIRAMVADYMAHEVYLSLSDKTRKEYAIYLNLFVEKFGDRYWRKLSQGEARQWIVGHAARGGPSGAHALYRTVRAFFGQVRLVYTDVEHPGIVREHENPFTSLNLTLPKSLILLWPREAVDAFVMLADTEGQPSIGDAIVMMSWIGVRKQDWLHWPATIFDSDILAFAQEKTDKPLVIPWTIVTPLLERVAAARRRRAEQAITARTFFHDAAGLPWGSDRRFRDAFNALRDKLTKKHPAFATRYYVGLLPNDPLRLPTPLLTVRTLRHTCITLNHDAGVSRDLMPAITGHEPKTIDEVLAHYRARTADQAAAALELRVAHENKKGSAA